MGKEMQEQAVYDPVQFARRGSTEEPNKEKDKAGRGVKAPVHGCRLSLSIGEMSMRYGLLTGHPWMNKEQSIIEIPIQGRIKLEGEWKPNADYLITIKGRNLEVIFDQLNEDRRVTIHRSMGADGDEAHVDGFEIEPMRD